jgi:hypothetical protein
MSRIPCPSCRDEHGDPLGDLRATAPGERGSCPEPDCREGWIELEECQGCGREVRSRNLYQLGEEWLCLDCHDERTADAPQPVRLRKIETFDLANFEAVKRALGFRP